MSVTKWKNELERNEVWLSAKWKSAFSQVHFWVVAVLYVTCAVNTGQFFSSYIPAIFLIGASVSVI